MELTNVVVLLVGIIATVTVTAVVLTVVPPVRNSWIRRLSRRAAIESADVEAELVRMKERMAELEERIDFAERLLAQSRDPERRPRLP